MLEKIVSEKEIKSTWVCTCMECDDMTISPKHLCCLVCPLKEKCNYQCELVDLGEVTSSEECKFAKEVTL